MTTETAQKRLSEAEEEHRRALDEFVDARRRLETANQKRAQAQKDVIDALQRDIEKAQGK